MVTLTKTQQDILNMLSDDFLTTRKIAIRRKTSVQTVYKTIAILKKKGLINRLNKKVEKNRGTFKPCFGKKNKIRLHAQEFNIKLLYKDERYKILLNRANTLNIDGNTVRLYSNSIEIYSGQSFYGEDVQSSTAKSFNYWNRFFARLEHEFKVFLVKHRSQNIKLIKAHYAEINNEIARDYETKGEKFQIYTKEDGKIWFLIDNSFNLHEAETVHSQTSKQDMEKVREVFNDIRDNSPPNLTQITGVLKKTVDINKETASGLLGITKVIELQFQPKKEEKQEENNTERPSYVG